MKPKAALTLLVALITTSAWAAGLPEPAAPTWPTTDEVIDQFSTDLTASPADIMAQGLLLTSAEAANFWPMFDKFQKEQQAISDQQLRGLLQYRDTYRKLTDDDALDFANSLLKRDQQIHDLRVKYLAMFQEVVSPRVAARAIQLDRRLGNVSQVKISSHVPLIP